MSGYCQTCGYTVCCCSEDPTTMQFPLSRIDFDPSTQCRASINTELVSEYAEAMKRGDVFPEVTLVGDDDGAWIGDGWHRVLAAQSLGMDSVRAHVLPGYRKDAVRCSISANQVHGQRRTNADKRRCVEIALKEFPDLSSRQIAELCGVHHSTVESARPPVDVAKSDTSPRTDAIGRKQPAKKKKAAPAKRATLFPRDEEPAQDESEDKGEIGTDPEKVAFDAINARLSEDVDKLAAIEVEDFWLNQFAGACDSLAWRLIKIKERVEMGEGRGAATNTRTYKP